MDKTSILDVLFYARNTDIGQLKECDKEFLKLIESYFDIDSEFPDLDEEVRKNIKEYFNKIQNRIGMILSKYDEKYYKSRLVRLCKNIYRSSIL